MSITKAPVSVAVVVPEAMKNATTTFDIACSQNYTIPVGVELTEGVLQALSQAFDSVSLVNERPTAGEFDLVIEPTVPEMSVDGYNCYLRRGLWLVFPLKIFIRPKDSFEAQAALSVVVGDRSGHNILTETFRSQRHSQEAGRNEQPVKEVMRASLVDAIQRMTLGIVSTSQYRAYAREGSKSLGQSATLEAVVISDVDNPPQVSMAPQGNRFAVLIGIEQYRQKLPKVEFANHDAQIMREYLVKTLGFPEENVVTLINQNATKTDIEKYIERWLPNHVDKNSSVFVFYSGHGAPNTKTNEGYLLPYDGDPTFLEVTGYSLKRLYEQLGQLVAKENFVVLDSCFSGSGGRSVVAKGTRPVVITTESPALSSGKTVVLSASAGNQISNTYSPKGHGLLTYYLLKGLSGEADKNQDKVIDTQELYAYVKPLVEGTARREYNSEQTPQLIGEANVLRSMSLVGQPTP
jgi:hypothetical protein